MQRVGGQLYVLYEGTLMTMMIYWMVWVFHPYQQSEELGNMKECSVYDVSRIIHPGTSAVSILVSTSFFPIFEYIFDFFFHLNYELFLLQII